MSEDVSGQKKGLRSIRGGAGDLNTESSLRVVVTAEDRPPFPVDAVVVEDDTYSVLGADPEFREPEEHPLRIWTAVHDSEPAEPGTVKEQAGDPLRLLAVVHDLSLDPTWKEEWVASALAEVFRLAERRGMKSIALPALGAVHGRLPVERFVTLVREALQAHRPPNLERIWLIAHPGTRQELERLLR